MHQLPLSIRRIDCFPCPTKPERQIAIDEHGKLAFEGFFPAMHSDGYAKTPPITDGDATLWPINLCKLTPLN